jgi:hypothetical protein
MSPTATITWTYREFDIFNPKSWVFDINDIAQALSHQCRFNGHVDFYSVAEHCVRVSEILEAEKCVVNTQLMGLLHDGAEAYLGDVPGPWKKHVSINGRPVEEVEKEMELKMFEQLHIEYSDFAWDLVKKADKAAYLEEADARPAPGKGWDPIKAKYEFIKRYHQLKA